MAGQNIELEVRPRVTGKHLSRALRREAKVPAVVYGAKLSPHSIEADLKVVERVRKLTLHENPIFKLKSADSNLNGVNVLVKALDVHPVTRRPVHLDLFALDMTQAIRVHVQLKFEGKPIGLADGGNFQIVMRDVEVECLPTAIPESLSVDVSNLGVNDSVHIYDLQLPEGVKTISNKDLTIATVVVQAEETPVAAPAAAAAAPAAGGAAPAAGDAKAAAPAGDAKAPAKK
jgi:large subunit ribosomal protein L25